MKKQEKIGTPAKPKMPKMPKKQAPELGTMKLQEVLDYLSEQDKQKQVKKLAKKSTNVMPRQVTPAKKERKRIAPTLVAPSSNDSAFANAGKHEPNSLH